MSCAVLASITVDEKNPVYHSAGNCLIETASKTLIAGCKNSIIPDDNSVTKIGFSAFDGCSGLTSISIPSGVTDIDESESEYEMLLQATMESLLMDDLRVATACGVDLETFHAALEARLWEVGYNYVSVYYTDTEDGGKLYQVCDLSTGEAVDVYLLYYLCADGTTVDTLFSYSPSGQDETLSNLCGVYLGAAMYLLDADNATTNLANMMNNATESDDGMAVTYYTELNGYAYVMYLEQTSDTTIDITCGVSYTE